MLQLFYRNRVGRSRRPCIALHVHVFKELSVEKKCICETYSAVVTFVVTYRSRLIRLNDKRGFTPRFELQPAP